MNHPPSIYSIEDAAHRGPVATLNKIGMAALAALALLPSLACTQDDRPEYVPLGAELSDEPNPNFMYGSDSEPWLDTSDRKEVEKAYYRAYGTKEPYLQWRGSQEGCKTSEPDLIYAESTIAIINFYRALAGVPSGVHLDVDASSIAQQTALSMSASGVLSHNPKPDVFRCLTENASKGANLGNLYLGRIGIEAVEGYMFDPGPSNTDVGHRVSLLHPSVLEMGIGNVGKVGDYYSANSMVIFGNDASTNYDLREDDGFIAWPPRGYVPAPLVYPRWSFTLSGADFSHSSVTMHESGQSLGLSIERAKYRPHGVFPPSTLVWLPDNYKDLVSPSRDRIITVTIEDVTDAEGKQVDFAYDVKIAAGFDDFTSLGDMVKSAIEDQQGHVSGPRDNIVSEADTDDKAHARKEPTAPK